MSTQGIQGIQGIQSIRRYPVNERLLTVEEAMRIILSLDPVELTGQPSIVAIDENNNFEREYQLGAQGIQGIQGVQVIQGYKNHALRTNDKIIPSPLMLDVPTNTVILDTMVPAIVRVLQCLIEHCMNCDCGGCPKAKSRRKKSYTGGDGCVGHMCEVIHGDISCYCETYPDDPECINNPLYIPENCEEYNPDGDSGGAFVGDIDNKWLGTNRDDYIGQGYYNPNPWSSNDPNSPY
jgi:hypothetical protein